MIELRHLRYFVTLARELHFGRAARSLHIEQPALSHNLRQLESELGVRLLARTTRTVQLSEAGKAYLHEAVRLMKQMDDATHAARRAAKGETGRLDIGYDSSFALSSLPRVIRQFQRRYPDVELFPHEHLPEQLLEKTLSGELDLIYSCAMVQHPELDSVVMGEPRWCCVLHAEHRLAERKTIGWRELAGEVIALPPYSSVWGLHDALATCCREAGFLPNTRFFTDNILSTFGLVRANLCVSFAFHSESESGAGVPEVVLRPLLPARRARLQLSWRKNSLSHAADNFMQMCARKTRPSRA